MHLKTLAAIIASVALLSCGSNRNNADSAPEKVVVPQPQNTPPPVATQDLSAVKLDVSKDLVCGMPVKAGVEDTMLYKGKVYGFCAKECKEEFAKSPDKFIAGK